MIKRQRAKIILQRLRKTYRKRGEFVHWSNPLELVVGTMLSAQCTDRRVNTVTVNLFRKYSTAADYARAPLQQLQKDIGSITFYKSKSRYLKGIGQTLIKNFGGHVPNTRQELMMLPGIALKSANLIMAKVFRNPTGVAVDTHVQRVAPRLGLTTQKSPKKIAEDLEKIFLSKDWIDVNKYFIMHGRAVCKPMQPLCKQCILSDICPTGRKILKK